jgi:hypothetical protein
MRIAYVPSSTSLGTRRHTSSIGAVYSFIWSIGSTPSHTSSAFEVANWGNTSPGQSQRVISSVKMSVWKCLVFPGVAETETRLPPRRALIVDDFPTLGYPTRPTTSLDGRRGWN